MSFPPPGHFLTNLSAMASLMNMTPNQYQMTPMGGIMPMAVPGLQVPHMTTGISAPPGVTTISAPPMRKVTQDAPPILGVSQLPLGSPFIFPPLTSTSGVGVVTGVVNTGHVNQSKSSSSLSHNNSNSHSGNHKKSSSNGPSITVFVGNITERASDMLIRQLLSKCGAVDSWKRVQGANGKLQGFGFCEYSDPESAMKAIRLLHDFEVADKKLVVKADAKTQEKLDNYLKEKSPKGNDFADSGREMEDRELLNQLHGILKEHEIELSRDPDPNKAQSRRYDKRTGESTKPENLADMDMEEEKRSLIHREIDKFRDTYKAKAKQYDELVDENEKKAFDQDRKDTKGNDSRSRDDRGDRSDDRYSHGQLMEVDSENSRRERQRERTPLSKERSRNRDRYDRERHERSERNDRNSRMERNDRDRERERERERDRDRDRERERDRNRDRERERERDRADENVLNERIVEDDEEMQERRRLERKLREKEASYQKRLRNWEAREMRKMKDYKKYEMKQEMRKEEEIKEVRKLKQFLEDYDDDRDDAKYYKGSALARRLREREKEKEEDTRDRRQEKRELEELRRKLTEEGHPDPESEAQKRLNSSDNNRERDKIVSNKMRELLDDAKLKAKKIDDENSLPGIIESVNRSEMHVKSFTFTGINKMGHGPKQPANPILNSPGENSNPGSNGEKRKKFSVQDVFNSNDDDDSSSRSKKRRLPQLMDDNTDSNQSVLSGTTKSATSGIIGENSIKTNLSTEEKKKQVKLLIEKIPTTKEDLFKYTIDWSLVDANLMEKRIRPWVNKKITEYIGEEEQALLDFICSKLQAKTSAQSILDDVAMVLDDEAEVFVVKMWRLLIYEIEAKKIGLGK